MNNLASKKLFEASARHFMTDREKKLKKKLINLLRDDGKGHRHAKYAERLKKFDINIVPIVADPMFTAAISFDEGLIFIGEGFLVDENLFYQLNVLIRHELAHNLLMHQIRMMHKLGNKSFEHIGMSRLIHRLFNIIEDDEISNRKYSEEDKKIVRNMWLNGRLIGGLVTEDHRPDWTKLTVEEMYDKLTEEIEQIQNKLLSGKSNYINRNDFITGEILNTYIYTDTLSSSIIKGSLDDFVSNGFKTSDGIWAKQFQEIALKIYDYLKDITVDSQDLNTMLDDIAKSSPIKQLDLKYPADGKKIVTLYTPEEKYIALNVLKKFKSEYDEWYQKVKKVLNKYVSDFYWYRTELEDILNTVK